MMINQLPLFSVLIVVRFLLRNMAIIMVNSGIFPKIVIRVSENLWLQFIDYKLSGMALRHEAHFLGLSIHTCFRMRHKLYAAVSELAKKE